MVFFYINMQLGQNGINLIKHFESCKLSAYLDSVFIPTIGWGNTQYENGVKVKLYDEITQQRADMLFNNVVQHFVDNVTAYVKQPINQNQFDALVCLCYNIGPGNFYSSSVLRKININPNDPTITDSFKLWNKANGKVLEGLVYRRNAEAELYFKPLA